MMLNTVWRRFDDVKRSFWALPIAMAFVFAAIALAMLVFEETFTAAKWVRETPFLAFTAEGSRSLIQTVAGGIVTMAALVFSLTFVALTMMSQQLGPRLIQLFSRDSLTKFTFGLFVGAFLFCLIILAFVGTGNKGNFVPVFSTLFVIVLAMATFIQMLVYINHIARTIQADQVIARLGDDLREALDEIWQERERDSNSDGDEKPSDEDSFIDQLGDEPARLLNVDSGYVANIDTEKLLSVMDEHDLAGRVVCRPGHFIPERVPLMTLACDEADLTDEVTGDLIGCFALEPVRSVTETGEFEVNALVEIAVRALSPGINDPYTAAACVDQLNSVLSGFADYAPRADLLKSADGTPRLLLHSQGFGHFADAAFHPIRHAARDNPIVLSRLVNTLRVLAARHRTEQNHDTILAHLEAISDTIRNNVSTKEDRDHLLGRVKDAIGQVKAG